tara:strand:+ start:6281 stop:7192 length:912 start_codon:yes stop_codon:yes gene_type:complete
MRYTLHQLNIFSAVARYKNITKAAQSLNMTQPAVSIQLKQLQESLDIPLIEFISNKLTLTEAGEELLEMHKKLIDLTDSYDQFISEMKGGLRGSLKISAASTAKYFLPYYLGKFQKKFPQVKISLKITNRDEVLHHLHMNEYQIGILTQIPQDQSIISEPFLENPLVFACHPEHSLLKKSPITIKDLKDEAFIFREKGSGTRMIMEKILHDSGIKPKIAMELYTNEAVKQAIMADIGVSLISKISMPSELKLGLIACFDTIKLPIQTYWHTLHKKDKVVTSTIRNFLQFIKVGRHTVKNSHFQ